MCRRFPATTAARGPRACRGPELPTCRCGSDDGVSGSGRFQNSVCQTIDDVLLIDLAPAERAWVLKTMYPQSLELKSVCKTPDRILYLDLEIRHDRGGFHTILYDKRDVLREEGHMDAVRRFPHPSAALSEQCKYACLVSFLHRAARCDMRTKAFVRHAAARMAEMYADGYEAPKLVLKMQSFMRQHHRPQYRARAVAAQVAGTFSRAIATVQCADTSALFPEGMPMAKLRQ